MKAWITKYALTSGIFVVDAELVSATMITYKQSADSLKSSASGSDWHLTPEAAIARAEEMRTKKIASLRKSIAALEKMEFKA